MAARWQGWWWVWPGCMQVDHCQAKLKSESLWILGQALGQHRTAACQGLQERPWKLPSMQG